MDPFCDIGRDERILRQERLHGGIFAFPVILLVLMAIPTLAMISFINMTNRMIGQLGAPSGPSPFGILTVVLIGLDLLPALVVLGVVLAAYLKCQVTLTDKRLFYTTGLVMRSAGELALENIEATFVVEPLLGRIFGYGTVTACTLGGMRFPLAYLPKPLVFHAALQSAVAAAKGKGRPASVPGGGGKSRNEGPQDDSRYMPKG
jgi:hypothetical protein